MKFEGEHLLPGQLGHFFVLLAFVSSIISTIAYFKANRINDLTEKRSWIRYARGAFFVQLISVLTVFGIIFFICANHYFEYLYAYKHASKELEPKYLLACIWEGQEGSFLLWSIWHSLLGLILIFKSKTWEAPVMTVISFAQVFIGLMLIGIHVGNITIGSSAFVLTRNEIDAPIFSQPGYLAFIRDGVGLNVLLRNYWMVIHPPVLFLGFASTLVPVAFAYAGLVTKRTGEWVKPALPWALFSACILGIGIMMGGKWAYESLSFGGYWAWDPVENASLVPWIILIAGLHCMAIYNATGNSLRASFLFVILANAFVLYSTFLTRTGILGDTSVHSFTEAGITMNVLIGMFALAIPLPLFILLIKNWKRLPVENKEEDLSSREFWMFIGSLIFFLSAMFIIAITSVPVFNKIFNQHIADPQDREFTYNRVMVLVASIIGLLTGASQYFKYRKTEMKYFLPKILIPLLAAAAILIIMAFVYPIDYRKQGIGFLGAIYLALFSAIFSFIANGGYIWTVLKGNIKAGGAALAHTGFALMIIGMLISSGNKEVISDNSKTGLMIAFDKDPSGRSGEDPLENLTLLKNVPTRMARYMVTYIGDSAGAEKNRLFFNLVVKKQDDAGKITEDFVLTPDVYMMKDNNLSSNPDIKHYLFHDVFTYVSSVPNRSSLTDTAQFKPHEINKGDTIFYSQGYMVLNSVLKNPDVKKYHFTEHDTALVAEFSVYSKTGTSYKAYPYLKVIQPEIEFIDDTVLSQNLYLRFAGIAPGDKFRIAVKESEVPSDFVTLKAYIFPYINLIWVGLLIMSAGFVLAISRRLKASPAYMIIGLLAVAGGLFYMFLVAN